jgi:hypothetical protein
MTSSSSFEDLPSEKNLDTEEPLEIGEQVSTYTDSNSSIEEGFYMIDTKTDSPGNLKRPLELELKVAVCTVCGLPGLVPDFDFNDGLSFVCPGCCLHIFCCQESFEC